MNDFINRKAMIEDLETRLNGMNEMKLYNNAHNVERFIHYVEGFPSAEAKEVKHGCWMYGETDNPFVVEIYCPWCGKPALYQEEDERPVESDFCPHCGTIMDAPCADPSWPFFKNSLKQSQQQAED